MAQHDEEPRDQVVTVQQGPGTVLIIPRGPHLGEREGGIMQRAVDSVLAGWTGPLHALVLDLSDIESMSSVALGACIDLHHAADSRNAPVIIHGLNRTLRDLFRMVKVDRLFRIAEPGADLAA